MEPDSNEMLSAEDLQNELNLANRKLVEAHKMASLGRLSAGIVHEINTPIGSILANNETIRRSIELLKRLVDKAQTDNEAPAVKSQNYLETLSCLNDIDKIACERIWSVVRSLKTFARVNDGDLRTVNVHELLQNTLKLTQTVFKSRVTIVTEFAELPEVECFPGLLGQVFLNLIVNASQAIENDGTIRITTQQEGERVHIAIQDTGSGIPEEVRPKIFAAGFTTKPFGEGPGLGLTITRDIVEDTHGGKIEFETEMGVGTTFHVRIPIKQPRTQESA